MTSDSPENPYSQPSPQAGAVEESAPPPYPQQPYGQQPHGQKPYGQAGYPGAPVADPGKTMAIIAIIMPFVGLGLVGLILGLIAKSKSKKAGYKNTLALVAIIISIVTIVVAIIVSIFAGIYLADVSNQMQACLHGAQTVTINGQVIDCTTVNK